MAPYSTGKIADETYQFRAFDQSRDLKQVVNLYNTVFGPMRPYYSWPVSVERFTDKILSHWEFRPEGLQLAFDRQRLIGFILAAFRNQPLMDIDQVTGEWGPVFISAIAVDPHYRRHGIGRALIERTVEFARANSRDRLKVGANPQAPMSFFTGVQENWCDALHFLPSVGFNSLGTRQNMVRSIVGYRMDELIQKKADQLRAEGYECRPYEKRDYAALIKLLDEKGWVFWYLDMLSKVGRWIKTRPFIETCFLDCSTEHIYGPDEIGVVLKDGKMLSFCAQTLNRQTGKSYLGPMLTASCSRGLGLGMISLQLSLEQVARKGGIICDLWTNVDGLHTHFYKKSGFEQVMKWFDYEMKLE